MSELPGAEYAPSIIVGYVTERGSFYPTLDAIPRTIQRVDTREWVAELGVAAERQLNVHAPHDRRLILFEAAKKLGATDDAAETAHAIHNGYIWCLVALDPKTGTQRLNHGFGAPNEELPTALGALCRELWGPE
jgi:hypothetical protein